MGLNTLISKKTGKASKLKIDDLFIPVGELKSLSGKTIGHYHRVLSVMFHNAVRWGLIQENPCEKVQPPKAPRREMKCLDEEALVKMLECLETEDIRCKSLITLALMTGCRRGELAALQWESIDIGKAVIYIKQSAAYTPETGIIIKQPKTQSSNRKIAIPPSTIQILKQYRKWWAEQKVSRGDQWQKEEREKQGDTWKDPEWVFCTWDGYVIHPDTITDLFKKFMNRHNLPDIRLHDLRHTACTLLIHAGLNVRAVAARMGHANPNVTLTVYSHALQSADREAANIMEAITGKKDKTELSNQQ
jgi:integrase